MLTPHTCKHENDFVAFIILLKTGFLQFPENGFGDFLMTICFEGWNCENATQPLFYDNMEQQFTV